MQWKDTPQTLGTGENFFLTPIFIQNFNQLSYLQKLVNWLLAAGYKNICVTDNHSTYAPLLQFYGEIESRDAIKVVRRNQNGSSTTLWEEQLLERFGVTGPFIYTDSDIVPETFCPSDVVGRLASELRDQPQILKAGLGLRIDNLPASYKFHDEVITWEKQFWRAPVLRGVFLSPIDTTFALYRPNSTFAMVPALRTGWPYLARHETWYHDSENLSEEQRSYRSEMSWGHWSRSQLPAALKSAIATQADLHLKLLHLGCGHDNLPGWINLDRIPTLGADIVFDLEDCAERELPIAADTVDGLFMCHAFQQIDAILPMMQELHRVAKAGARFVIRLPHGASDESFADPAHKWPYFPSSFASYAQPAHAGTDSDYSGDWRVKRVTLVVDQNLIASESETQIRERIERELNVVQEMIVELRAVKPPRPRQPHLLEWPVPTISGTSFDAESDFQDCSPA